MTKAVFFIVFVLGISGCTKCVQCEVELKEGFLNVASIEEYCGTSDDIEAEEERLTGEEYACIECVVNTQLGQSTSGFLCGNRAFTDSVDDAWRAGALEGGYQHNCTYFRDTLEVICILKPE